jgi:hypothetical protein
MDQLRAFAKAAMNNKLLADHATLESRDVTTVMSVQTLDLCEIRRNLICSSPTSRIT